MKNFHLPLPEETYADLRAEAEREKIPATTIAREAISSWLRAKKKIARRNSIQVYAAQMAGTSFDLDPQLEAAGIEEMLKMQKAEK